jgi:pentatricopeptide repeat protein
VFPSGFTFSSVLNACARVPVIFEGKQVHARVVQSGFLGNKFVQTALLDMYAKCGFISDAWEVFDKMDGKDVVAWTAMICGYCKVSMMDEACRLFDKMGERNEVSWSTMVAGYANYGDMKAAKELYDSMPAKNSVTWVAMIAGYGKCGNVVEAQKVFEEIAVPDASSWAAMLVCYAQNGYAKEAIEMYKKMKEVNVKISAVAMVGAISACTQVGDIEMANTLAEHVEEGCCGKFL